MEGEISKIVDHLYLSDRLGAKDLVKLQALGVTRIVNVTEPPDQGGVHNFFQDMPNFVYLRLPLQDSDGATILPFLDQAVEFVHQAREQGHGVLVHCQQGVSRSPSIVIAYLMKALKMDLKSAYARVKSIRNKSKPKQNFLQQLIEYEKHLVSNEGKNATETKDDTLDESRKRKVFSVALPPASTASPSPLTEPTSSSSSTTTLSTEEPAPVKKRVYSVAGPPAPKPS